MELEYYLSGSPTNYSKSYLKKEILNAHLNVGVQTIISQAEMIHHDGPDFEDYLKREMTVNMARNIQGKAKWTAFDEPRLHSKVIRGEVIVMTEEDLVKLLSKFGVRIYNDEN